MSSILVAGGAGYIGSHTVKELRARGYEVVIFDDLSSGRRDFVRGAELVVGDLMEETIGQRPSWKLPRAAPEHERGGNA